LVLPSQLRPAPAFAPKDLGDSRRTLCPAQLQQPAAQGQQLRPAGHQFLQRRSDLRAGPGRPVRARTGHQVHGDRDARQAAGQVQREDQEVQGLREGQERVSLELCKAIRESQAICALLKRR